MALLAFLVGRKVQDKRDNRSNIYLIALADSGTGKDHPRKVNFNIAFHSGIAGSIGDAFASGEGLEDALFMHPSMLFQADEFDCIFNTMKYNKDARAESINEKLLKFYGSANTIYPLRKKATVKRKDGNSEEIAHIVNPNLVLLGTAIPQYFYESLSRRVLENGLVARCIIVEAGKRGEAGNPQPIAPADSLLRAAKYLVNLDVSGNLGNESTVLIWILCKLRFCPLREIVVIFRSPHGIQYLIVNRLGGFFAIDRFFLHFMPDSEKFINRHAKCICYNRKKHNIRHSRIVFPF